MENITSRTSIQVIDRMMDVIDILSKASGTVNLKEIAKLSSLHPSTAHRILNALAHYNMIERVESGTYRLGTKFLELGNITKANLDFRKEALPFMQSLHAELQETINLSVRQGDEMVYIERISTERSAMKVAHLVGAKAPLHITAVGKIFLLEDGRELTIGYIRRCGLQTFTQNTIKDAQSLFEELDRINLMGYALDDEEAEPGVSCIGAGIRDDSGKLVAGLSVSSPSNRLNKSWGTQIKDAAEAISKSLGYKSQKNAA